MIQRILSHMNDHHKAELAGLAQKFGGLSSPKEVSLIGVDTKGLDILADGVKLRADFPKEVEISGLKDAIIELCSSVPKTTAYEDIQEELSKFKAGFGSVVLASLSADGKPLASYAPLLRFQDRLFIYISEVADHYASIRANPDKLEVLFLEDEKEAKSVILRKRLKYRAKAEFKPKDAEFEKIFDAFEAENPKAGGLKTIRGMADFHLIELHLQEGRFVKGFGAAYDIDATGNLKFAAESSGNPHQMPHKK